MHFDGVVSFGEESGRVHIQRLVILPVGVKHPNTVDEKLAAVAGIKAEGVVTGGRDVQPGAHGPAVVACGACGRVNARKKEGVPNDELLHGEGLGVRDAGGQRGSHALLHVNAGPVRWQGVERKFQG